MIFISYIYLLIVVVMTVNMVMQHRTLVSLLGEYSKFIIK